jgi:excisionase family DNA binding protein
MILYSVSQAAKELRLAPITIRRMARAGRITYRRLGNGGRNSPIFFTNEDLESYLESAAVPAKTTGGRP